MPVPSRITHQFRIRQATPDDAAAVAEISQRIFTRTFGHDNVPAQLAAYVKSAFSESLQLREINDPACTYLLVDVDGTLVAFALLRHGATNPSVHGDRPVEIQRFYVDHDFHGSGVAAQLMDACLKAALSRGGRTVWLGVWEENPKAIRFYEKHEFVEVGKTLFHMGTDVQHDRVMARSIGPAPVPDKVNLAHAFARIDEHWHPRIAGSLNGQDVKLVKFQGVFVWHHHEHEDEMFLVHRGRLTMEFRDRSVTLDAGDFLIVPRGVEHRPVAEDEVEVLLFEPAGTLNTGNVRNERTVEQPKTLF